MATDFLKKYFAPIVDYEFTAKVEQQFDHIADGKGTWQSMIDQFYNQDFSPLLKSSEQVTRTETAQARELGTDPKSGLPVIARYGRFGPMLQRGETTAEEKPTFAPLPAGTTLDSVTLEQALEMFKLPRVVGTTPDGESITGNIGRFGPYVQVGKKYYSLKTHDPLTITEAEARDIIAEAREAQQKAILHEFSGGVRVLNGRFGPYVTDGSKNARVPKSIDPQTITEDQAKELLKNAKPAAKRPTRGKPRGKTKK